MRDVDIPLRIDVPFATNAGGSYVRAIPDTTTDPFAASYNLGFPPGTATPVGGGGQAPVISDFNGVLLQITQWCRWQAAGAPIFYDSMFSSGIGGYPKGAVLANASTNGSFWLSTVDNNTSDPDTGGANWTGFTLLGLAPLISPGFTTPTRNTTPAPGDNSSQLANTAFVTAAIATLTTAVNASIAAIVSPIAVVSFFGRGTNGTCTLITGSIGVTSVTRTATGIYNVLTTGNPRANSATAGGASNSNVPIPGCTAGGGISGTLNTFYFTTLASTAADPDTATITIY